MREVKQIFDIKWIFEKWDGGGHGLDRSVYGYGQVAGCCECGNEPTEFVKCGEFLDCLRICQLLRKDFAPWNYLGSG